MSNQNLKLRKRAQNYHFKITYIYLSSVNSSFICSENTIKAIRVPFSAMLNRLIIYQIYDQHLLIQYNGTGRSKISENLSKQECIIVECVAPIKCTRGFVRVVSGHGTIQPDRK